MKLFLLVLVTVVSFKASAYSSERSVIHHPTCNVLVQEAVNYRGSGAYTDLRGPIEGYAQLLQDSLISNLGYKEASSSQGAVVITLRTSFADFYVNKNDGFSMKKQTSFCYVEAESSEFSDIGFYQESRNCKKSLKAVVEQMPKCEVIKN